MQNKNKPKVALILAIIISFVLVVIIILLDISLLPPYGRPIRRVGLITPTDSNLNTNAYFGNEFVQVESPQKSESINNPVLISGKANVFEGNVRVRIKDKNENILADTFITAFGAYDKLYPFEKEISYTAPTFQNGIVEIFEEDMKDGGEKNKIIIPVVFEDYVDAL